MRRLHFGGSFNPIHHGHLICSQAVAEKAGYDRVVLLPSAHPPHKPRSATMADSADRLAMCQAAVTGDPFFEVNDLELRRPAPSYTLHTARALAAQGQGPVHWLIGADMLLYLPQWYQPLELIKEVTLVIMARPGWSIDWTLLPPEFRHLQHNLVEAPLIDLSATQLRQRVSANLPIRYMTPDAVCQHIESRSLYR